jgi:hypothetical protein
LRALPPTVQLLVGKKIAINRVHKQHNQALVIKIWKIKTELNTQPYTGEIGLDERNTRTQPTNHTNGRKRNQNKRRPTNKKTPLEIPAKTDTVPNIQPHTTIPGKLQQDNIQYKKDSVDIPG